MADPLNCIFLAKVAKGYVPKTTFDAIASSMSRITIRLHEDGIFIREADCENISSAHMMWNVEWPRDRFSKYKCKNNIAIILNAKHLQKMLRNVKKKDSLTFFIKKDDLTKLHIMIQPTGNRLAGPEALAEIVHLNIQIIEKDMPDLPEFYENENGEEIAAYGHPMIIGSTDFQKIKKMSGTVKTLVVKMQGHNFISFTAGDSSVMSSDLIFGELIEKDDSLNNISSSKNSVSKNKSNNKKDVDSDGECDNIDDEEISPIYEKEFMMSLFVPLVKLPGLTNQMNFYAPKHDDFPLKISMTTTSNLGSISVFIKDQKRIILDEDATIQEESKTKKTKK